MDREEVVAALAAELNIDRASADRICKAFAGVMAGGFRGSGRFGLNGLGTFERKKHPDGTQVIFRASSGLRRMVQAAIDVEQLWKQAASTTVVVPCGPVSKANISGAPFTVPAASGPPSGTTASRQQESGTKQRASMEGAPRPATPRASMSQDPERCEIPAASRTTVPKPAEAELQQPPPAANGPEETTPKETTPIQAEPSPKQLQPEVKAFPIGVRPPIPAGFNYRAILRKGQSNQWTPVATSSAAAKAVPADLPRVPGTPATAAPQEEEKGEAREAEDGEIPRLIKELAETDATPEQVHQLEGFAGSKLRLLKCLRFIYGTGYRFSTFNLLACCVADECRASHSRFGLTETT